MAKFDVERAYCNVPIHPSHRYLLGLKQRNQFHVDLSLPSGLRSAPIVFNTIAEVVECTLLTSYQIPDTITLMISSLRTLQSQPRVSITRILPRTFVNGQVWLYTHASAALPQCSLSSVSSVSILTWSTISASSASNICKFSASSKVVQQKGALITSRTFAPCC